MEPWEGQTGDEMWEKMCEVLYEWAEKVCSKSKEECPREKKMWWWNEVQIAIREKRKAYKALKDGLRKLRGVKEVEQKSKT